MMFTHKTEQGLHTLPIVCYMLLAALCIAATSASAQSSAQQSIQSTTKHSSGSLLSNMADMFSPGVVRVEPSATDGQVQSELEPFAAFFVGPGRLVTSRSLLFAAQSATVVLDTGDEFVITKVLAEDVGADLVLAYIDIPARLQRGLRVSPLEPLIGEEVMLIGPPIKKVQAAPSDDEHEPNLHTAEHAVYESTIASRQNLDELQIVTMRKDEFGSLGKAYTGSPVLSIGGQAIGIVVHDTTSEDPSATRIVTGSQIASLTETPGLPMDAWLGGASLEDVVRAAREAARNAVRPEGFAPPPEKFGSYDVVPASIEVRTADDGTRKEIILDGRFVVTGSGTEADPYIVPWELLTSLRETFKPRNGLSEFPERITMFQGAWVRLTGFISFPFVMDESDELLLMVNTWDGCCIGVPPTPYDAIEVLLADMVDGDDLYTSYATITGKLRSDPYMVGKWLVGMYVMDEATMSPTEFGGVDN